MVSIGGQLDALEDSLRQAGRTNTQVRQARRAALAAAIEADPTEETPGALNVDRATAMFTQPSDDQLVAFFDRRPDVIHAILGDIYIVSHYEEKKRRGEGRDGRRTMPRDANLDALWDLITPRYSQQPFGLAVRELMGERSLRQFAGKVPMDHRELSRLMRGRSAPSLYVMEQIASAAKVNPAFFLEYRVGYVTERMTQVFAARPNLSIGVFKKLRSLAK